MIAKGDVRKVGFQDDGCFLKIFINNESTTRQLSIPINNESTTRQLSIPINNESTTRQLSIPINNESTTRQLSIPINNESTTRQLSSLKNSRHLENLPLVPAMAVCVLARNDCAYDVPKPSTQDTKYPELHIYVSLIYVHVLNHDFVCIQPNSCTNSPQATKVKILSACVLNVPDLCPVIRGQCAVITSILYVFFRPLQGFQWSPI